MIDPTGYGSRRPRGCLAWLGSSKLTRFGITPILILVPLCLIYLVTGFAIWRNEDTCVFRGLELGLRRSHSVRTAFPPRQICTFEDGTTVQIGWTGVNVRRLPESVSGVGAEAVSLDLTTLPIGATEVTEVVAPPWCEPEAVIEARADDGRSGDLVICLAPMGLDLADLLVWPMSGLRQRREVSLGAVSGELIVTDTASAVAWDDDEERHVVLGPPTLTTAPVTIAAWLAARTAIPWSENEKRGEIPDGYVLSYVAPGPLLGSTFQATRFRTPGVEVAEITIRSGSSAARERLAAAMIPFGGRSGVAHVRGARALLWVARAHRSDGRKRIGISWLERPDVLVTVTVTAEHVTPRTVARIAENLRFVVT